MPIDPSVAIGATVSETTFSWTRPDVLLYHLALGAGADPVSDVELRYTTEQDLHVLPTFGVIAPNLRQTEPPKVSFPGVEIDLAKVLHGQQEITVHRPLPSEATATVHTRITDVFDKGKAAVIVQEATAVDTTGDPLYTTRSSIFARGEGGFGGSRGPSSSVEPPDRAPDFVLDTPSLPQQALLYRLCGDRNPLHSDPAFAAAAGFPRPILHGLCTYGMVCKAVTDGVLGGDVSQVAGFATRFAGVVFPGETLRSQVWQEDKRLLVTCSAGDRPVLADTVLTLC
ncbi:MaoC/PaaZ C-terminal domain-containing protein [Kibdelosporangium phytohabitans]|uniref:3-alpha,7-alpha, 12-alpha-trihydroxy-5-beta-cholest-24-enoyl-CoA hydratase n=1 Tax=Kibdelosporangium phytohabitans TaxID=860235 RepID=A0A0N9IBY2_9PSEU|nr:MaoC/PaaZ C-terminal domain-containing protein [Kibdelosporangium phytohabitans]ALG12705.1 3-alpha,7-alpha,12-alpha-trihydroxy-5-beta-cholest-24-enoyl-CoA hydratase [Kibdelosporangium phytohabitans]MBE1464371.1 acyl dehydratase [Kibdelosporangium phytohabitans]